MARKGLILIIGIAIVSFLFIGILSGCGASATEEAFIVDHTAVVKEVPFGTELSIDGIVIRVKLSNGTFATLKRGGDGYSINDGGYDKETPGAYTIRISYKEYDPVSFVIAVLEEEIIDENYNPNLVMTGIKVKNHTGKRLFAFGESFSGEGIVVEKLMSDSTSSILDSSQYVFDDEDFDSTEVGTHTISVIYPPNEKFFDTYTITVTPAIVPILTSISILYDDAKTEFLFNENFNAAGIVVEKHYVTDNVMETEIAALSELTISSSNYKKDILGKYNIMVTIKDTDVSSTYQVEVIDYLASITVGTAGAKTFYRKDQDDFLSDGLTVFETTASGINEQGDISNYNIDSSAFDKNTEGTYSIVVSRSSNPSITTSYDVTVGASIIVRTDNAKTIYIKDQDDFLSDGLIIFETTASGISEQGNISNYTIDSSAFDKSTVGTYAIVVSLISNPSIKTSYDVTVVEDLE